MPAQSFERTARANEQHIRGAPEGPNQAGVQAGKGPLRATSGRAVFRALVDADVRFLVAGGLAVNVHGFARAFEALASVGYRPTVPVSEAEFGDAAVRERWVREKNMRVLRFHSDEHWDTPVDVFASEPFSFDEEYDRAVIRELTGIGGVRVVSLTTLMQMKQDAGRPQDIADVDNLRLRIDSHD